MIKKFGRWIAYDIQECGGVMSAMIGFCVLTMGLVALAVTFSNGGW